MNNAVARCARRRPRSRRSAVQWLLPALLGATTLAAFSACDVDKPPPNYLVQDTTLRLVPEQQTIADAGGPVFVLLELARPNDGGSSKPVLAYVKAEGASIAPLPGPPGCGEQQGDGGASDAGADASSSSGDDGGAAQSGTLTLPYAAFLDDGARSVREAGFVLHVPEGDGDVLVVATAYEHSGAPGACDAPDSQSVAIASARIVRAKPDAGVEDASADADADAGEAASEAEAGTDDAGEAGEAGGDAAGEMDAGVTDGGGEAG